MPLQLLVSRSPISHVINTRLSDITPKNIDSNSTIDWLWDCNEPGEKRKLLIEV